MQIQNSSDLASKMGTNITDYIKDVKSGELSKDEGVDAIVNVMEKGIEAQTKSQARDVLSISPEAQEASNSQVRVSLGIAVESAVPPKTASGATWEEQIASIAELGVQIGREKAKDSMESNEELLAKIEETAEMEAEAALENGARKAKNKGDALIENAQNKSSQPITDASTGDTTTGDTSESGEPVLTTGGNDETTAPESGEKAVLRAPDSGQKFELRTSKPQAQSVDLVV